MEKIPKTYHIAGTKYHLVAIVEDGTEEIVVSKYWLPCKQRWEYEAFEKARVLIGIQITKSQVK